MKIKKGNLEVLFNVVKGTEGVLSLSESRARDAFAKPLKELVETFINDRNSIYDSFSISKELQPDGKTITWIFPPEKQEEIQKELETLVSEEVEVEAAPVVKEILEKTTYSPKIGESEVIDSLIQSI